MRIQVFVALSFLAWSTPLVAEHPCTSPLILDLNGDGIQIYGVSAGVDFDIDGDGQPERIAWTNPWTTEGFLWLDLNGNHIVDDGGELFGTATRLPTGGSAENGFEALAAYDRPALGGNGDGVIAPDDLVWRHLRVWIDRNQDGVSQRREIDRLKKWNISAIPLDYVESLRVDGTGSWHRFEGHFVQRVKELGAELLRVRRIEDVFFAVEDEADH